MISRKGIALTFLSMIRNAPTPVRIASSVILQSGTGFLQKTRPKFWSTAMQLKEKWFGSMLTPL
jgi:hypothetical protein